MQRCFDRVTALVPFLGVLGCSDPVPASSAVGLNLNVSQTGTCPMMVGIDDDIGNPKPDSSIGDRGTRIFDGEGGVGVQCSVRAAGNDSYAVSASISSENPRVAFNVDNGEITAGAGTALIGLNTRGIGNAVTTPPDSPCTLTVVTYGGEKMIKPGAIWASFNCQKLINAPNLSCAAYGEFLLENCSR